MSPSIPNFFEIINEVQLGFPVISLANTVMSSGMNSIPIARSTTDFTMTLKFDTFSFSSRDLQIAVKTTKFKKTPGK
jgi:hypothetical protein